MIKDPARALGSLKEKVGGRQDFMVLRASEGGRWRIGQLAV